jgi:transposase
MMVTTIGIDPHKATHTAVAIDGSEIVLGEFTIRADKDQTTKLIEWAGSVDGDGRLWAVEAATGLGHLLSQQLVARGETVVDVPPVLASRIRVLSSGKSNKNDENDARSVAIAALRRDGLAEVGREGEAAVLRMLAKRHRELTALRTQAVCRLHAILAVLKPGGMGHRLSAKQASRMLGGIRGLDAVGEQRRLMAKTHLVDIRRLDRDLEAIKTQIRTAVTAADTSVTDIYGVGPVVAAFLIGYSPPIERFGSADRYAAYNGTAPIEVSSGGKVRHRLSRRGNRTLNHAIHTAAVTQISHDTPGRVYYDKKLDEGKTNKEALRALKRRISDAVYRRLVVDAARHHSN